MEKMLVLTMVVWMVDLKEEPKVVLLVDWKDHG
jgi:hypothetical protein